MHCSERRPSANHSSLTTFAAVGFLDPGEDYTMRRREFIAGLGSAAVWPAVARAQQPALPVVALISTSSSEAHARFAAAFRAALGEFGYADGQNVSIEYHWLEGRYDRLPALLADLVRRRVTVIATPANTMGAIVAKAATSTIPIVFGVGDDPVRLGLVASLAHPGGNATGINFFSSEAVSKRMSLLHDLVPKAARIAVVVNPGNSSTAESTLREIQNTANALDLQVDTLKASTAPEIEEAFAVLARERIAALFITGDGYFTSRVFQFVTLAARHGIATSYSFRDFAAAGGLMSYEADFADMFRQVGAYTGRILRGERPADLPVVQSTRFEFVINLGTARALGIEVPPNLLALADEVIE
jgi:putative ABC transport system substrate-binding protein